MRRVALGAVVLACSAAFGGCGPSRGLPVTTPLPPAPPAASTTPPAASTTPTTSQPSSTTTLLGDGSGCRTGNPLANVYHPYRLKLRARCLGVVGTVAYVRVEDDGDVHVDLRLLPSEDHLLNSVNISKQYGELVTEIVPADRPGCTPGLPPAPAHGSYNYGICTGADIHIPPIGALVRETGPYVLDADHGWMEIHPIWRLKILRLPIATTTTSTSTTTTPSSSTTTTQVAPPPPSTSEPPPPPTTVPTAWCKASSVPYSGYPGDYDIYVSSNEPYKSATAHSATDTYGYETNGQGSAVIYLFYQQPGETVTVTVGPATCYTTDP